MRAFSNRIFVAVMFTSPACPPACPIVPLSIKVSKPVRVA